MLLVSDGIEKRGAQFRLAVRDAPKQELGLYMEVHHYMAAGGVITRQETGLGFTALIERILTAISLSASCAIIGMTRQDELLGSGQAVTRYPKRQNVIMQLVSISGAVPGSNRDQNGLLQDVKHTTGKG